MNQYTYTIIAREGWPFLAGSVLIVLLATVGCAAGSIPLWIIALFVMQFFRDPPREIPQGVGNHDNLGSDAAKLIV